MRRDVDRHVRLPRARGRIARTSARSGAQRAPAAAIRAGSIALACIAVAALSSVLTADAGAAGAAGAAGENHAPRHHPDRFDRVVIDAGHGGEDEGARGPRGLTEKELVLDVARRVARALETDGVEVLLTRSDDTFVPLEERTSRANDARADLFVSIHANSATAAKPSGVETYFVSLDASDADAAALAARENEAFGDAGRKSVVDDPLTQLLGDMIVNEYVRESSEFAKLVQHELAGLDGARSRGVKQAPFVVLMGVQMPAALIEIGFVSNPDEEKQLRQGAHRDALASRIVTAVRTFGARADARRGVDQGASLFPDSTSHVSAAAR